MLKKISFLLHFPQSRASWETPYATWCCAAPRLCSSSTRLKSCTRASSTPSSRTWITTTTWTESATAEPSSSSSGLWFINHTPPACGHVWTRRDLSSSSLLVSHYLTLWIFHAFNYSSPTSADGSSVQSNIERHFSWPCYGTLIRWGHWKKSHVHHTDWISVHFQITSQMFSVFLFINNIGDAFSYTYIGAKASKLLYKLQHKPSSAFLRDESTVVHRKR